MAAASAWGTLDDFDQICRNLVLATGGTVASVGYRLAPQHPFPAGLDDVVEAARWAAAEIGDLAGPEALFILAGDGAGGCLAAGAAQRLRDEGGPALDGQILIYPMIEYHDRTPASFHDLARRLVGSVPCRPCVEQTTCGTIWPAVDGVRRS